MFRGCINLTYLDLTNFDTQNVIIMMGMFTDCTSLVGAIPYDENNTNEVYANYNTGYFTKPYPAVGEGVAYAIYNSPYETLILKYGKSGH